MHFAIILAFADIQQNVAKCRKYLLAFILKMS